MKKRTKFNNQQHKFNLGKVVVTRGIHALIEKNDVFKRLIDASIRKHHHGLWGELCDFDREQNEAALENGERLMSVYHLEYLPKISGHLALREKDNKIKVYIITERVTYDDTKGVSERPATTILLPMEY